MLLHNDVCPPERRRPVALAALWWRGPTLITVRSRYTEGRTEGRLLPTLINHRNRRKLRGAAHPLVPIILLLYLAELLTGQKNLDF